MGIFYNNPFIPRFLPIMTGLFPLDIFLSALNKAACIDSLS